MTRDKPPSPTKRPGVLGRLKSLLTPQPRQSTEVDQARNLIAAIDAGGVPLNPARVNQIARALGLEVSTKAPVEDTIQRIREALGRM